jgi:hypothetical protein
VCFKAQKSISVPTLHKVERECALVCLIHTLGAGAQNRQTGKASLFPETHVIFTDPAGRNCSLWAVHVLTGDPQESQKL